MRATARSFAMRKSLEITKMYIFDVFINKNLWHFRALTIHEWEDNGFRSKYEVIVVIVLIGNSNNQLNNFNVFANSIK